MAKVPDEVSCLEFLTFRIPYEKLNTQFRDAQKAINRQCVKVQDVKKQIDDVMTESQPIKVQQAAKVLADFRDRAVDLRTLMDSTLTEQENCVQQMRYRAKYLEKGLSGRLSNAEQWRWNKERVDRLVLQHLARVRNLGTARLLAEKTKLYTITDISIYEQISDICDALCQHNVTPCLNWVHEHRSRLKRMSSNLEIELRIQEAVLMIEQGKNMEALRYTRRYLLPTLSDAKVHVDDNGVRVEKKLLNNRPFPPVRQLAFAIGTGKDTVLFAELNCEDRWKDVIALFQEESAAIYQIPRRSMFSTCLQAGISAYKTPSCAPNSNPKCIACDSSIQALSEGLPFAHAANSRLVCPITGELMDESNVPMMLPNGRVYSEKAIILLRQGDIFTCPRTKTSYQLSDIKRIFVL